MSIDRATIRAATIALLDATAEVHPLGHQEEKARRYVLQAPGGVPVEIMFEQKEPAPPNLWMRAEVALAASLPGKVSPAAKLRTKIGKAGQPTYGRHSALEKMPQLGEANLIYVTPRSLAELGAAIDALFAASSSRISF